MYLRVECSKAYDHIVLELLVCVLSARGPLEGIAVAMVIDGKQ